MGKIRPAKFPRKQDSESRNHTRMKKNLLHAFCSLVAFGALQHPTHATVVYQNTTGDLNLFLGAGLFEVGDEIILGPGGSSVTNFTFQYSLTALSGNEQARVRFYKNDGALFNGFATPGSVVFDSGNFNIAAFGTGAHTLRFDTDFGSGLLVPNDFTWSVQFAGIETNESAGPALFNPVTVGGNYNDYWDKGTNGWELKQWQGNPMNFAARFEAVPEPSTLALGLIGGAAALILSRRNKR